MSQNDIGVNAQGLAELEARSPPSQRALELGSAMCDKLPGIMREAIDAGFPLTAQALQQAVQHVGWERAAQLDKLTGASR